MRIGVARRACAAIATTAVVAVAGSGLTTATAVADGSSGASAKLGGQTQLGPGRTVPGPWGGGWRDGTTPPTPVLNGDWAPFDRCPVDNPAMLAADGVKETSFCLALHSPSGGIQLGNLSLPSGESDTQFGLLIESHEEAESSSRLVVPRGGVLRMAPIHIPDGLTAMVCPVAPQELPGVCGDHGAKHLSSRVADIAATVEQAGELSSFNLLGVLSVGVTFVAEPVRVHLQNPVLGPHCYIGSTSEPIVLQLQGLTPFTSLQLEDATSDGTALGETSGPLRRAAVLGSSMGDQSFAVPGVTGCGAGGSLDGALDTSAGLPAAAGSNSLVFDETADYLIGLAEPAAFAPNAGMTLSQDWHSAILSGPGGRWDH